MSYADLHYWACCPFADVLAFSLSLVCLLHYANTVFNRIRERDQQRNWDLEAAGMAQEIGQLEQDRALVRFENHVLHDFFQQTDFRASIIRLLKHFIPHPNQDWMLFLEFDGDRAREKIARGLEETVAANLEFDAKFLNRLRNGDAWVLEDRSLWESELFSSLPIKQRQNLRRLYFCPARDDQGVFGAMVSTRLFPFHISDQQQLTAFERLLTCLASRLRQSLIFNRQTDRLKLTTEMLTLRSIADSEYESPMMMIEEFVCRLMEMIETDHCALFLSTRDQLTRNKLLTRCGQTLSPGIMATWQEFEHLLADHGLKCNSLSTLDDASLRAVGVHALIGSALVVPLRQKNNNLGVLCFTSRDAREFSKAHIRLSKWAAEFLAETILKVLSHAATKREASQDGLTGLLNRRVFDQSLARELRNSISTNRECALCLLDIDHFKAVNDVFGHQAGDEALRLVAHEMRERISHVRIDDRPILARYGGEEMAVILPGVGSQGAVRIAESIREQIEQLRIYAGADLFQVTVSLGIACCPHNGTTSETIIAHADSALYRAKQTGRNRVCVADRRGADQLQATPSNPATGSRPLLNQPMS